MADEPKTGAIWDGDTLTISWNESDAEKTGLAEFKQHKKALLDMLRDVHKLGPKSKPFDEDKAWRSLTGLAGFYFRQGSVKQESMPAADRVKRLRDIIEVLERARDLISEAMQSDVGGDLYSAWCEANACFREDSEDLEPPLTPVRINVFDPVRTKREFDKAFANLATLEAAASRAAVDIPPTKRGRRAILPRDEIWNLAALYRDSTGSIPGAGEGPFAEFVVEVLTAQGRYNDDEDKGKRATGAIKHESVVDVIKDARHWALTHPAARNWGQSPFDNEE
jgi:hypothetical protein